MTDVTKIYHYESLDNFIEGSTIKKLEVNRVIYEGQANIENIINKKLEYDLSQKFVFDR